MAHPWLLAKTLMYISSAPPAIGLHCPTVNQKICLAVLVVEQAEGHHLKVHAGEAAPPLKCGSKLYKSKYLCRGSHQAEAYPQHPK